MQAPEKPLIRRRSAVATTSSPLHYTTNDLDAEPNAGREIPASQGTSHSSFTFPLLGTASLKRLRDSSQDHL